MVRLIKKPLQDQEEYAKEEDDYRNLINPMHHPDIDVSGSGGVFFPEEIATDLSQREEISDLLLVFSVVRFHELHSP